MAIGINMGELSLKYDIYAEQNSSFVPFQRNIEVFGLLIKKKMN